MRNRFDAGYDSCGYRFPFAGNRLDTEWNLLATGKLARACQIHRLMCKGQCIEPFSKVIGHFCGELFLEMLTGCSVARRPSIIPLRPELWCVEEPVPDWQPVSINWFLDVVSISRKLMFMFDWIFAELARKMHSCETPNHADDVSVAAQFCIFFILASHPHAKGVSGHVLHILVCLDFLCNATNLCSFTIVEAPDTPFSPFRSCEKKLAPSSFVGVPLPHSFIFVMMATRTLSSDPKVVGTFSELFPEASAIWRHWPFHLLAQVQLPAQQQVREFLFQERPDENT